MFAFSLYRCPQCCRFYDPMEFVWVGCSWLSSALIEVCLKPIFSDTRTHKYLFAMQANTSEYAKATYIHMPSLTGDLRNAWNVSLRYNLHWRLCDACAQQLNARQRRFHTVNFKKKSTTSRHAVVVASVKRGVRHAWAHLLTSCSIRPSHRHSLADLDGDSCGHILTYLTTADIHVLAQVNHTWAYYGTQELQHESRVVERWNELSTRGVFVDFDFDLDSSGRPFDRGSGSRTDSIAPPPRRMSMVSDCDEHVARGGFLLMLRSEEQQDLPVGGVMARHSRDIDLHLPGLTKVKWTYIAAHTRASPEEPEVTFDSLGFPLVPDYAAFLLPPQRALVRQLQDAGIPCKSRAHLWESSGVLCHVLEWSVGTNSTHSHGPSQLPASVAAATAAGNSTLATTSTDSSASKLEPVPLMILRLCYIAL